MFKKGKMFINDFIHIPEGSTTDNKLILYVSLAPEQIWLLKGKRSMNFFQKHASFCLHNMEKQT